MLAQTPKLSFDDPSPVTFGPNETKAVTWTVLNTGSVAGDVTLTFSPPSPWTGGLEDADQSFALPANTPREITILLSYPRNDSANRSAEAVLGGIIAVQGQTQDSDTGRATLSYVAPAAPPPPAPPAAPPPPSKLPAILAIAFSFAILAVGFWLWQGSRVALVADPAALRLNSGTDGVYRVRVTNLAPGTRNVQLRVVDRPSGWHAAFSAPTVMLSSRESIAVPLHVKVPLAAAAGSLGLVRVQARPNRFSPWVRSMRLSTDVVDVPASRP